MLPSVPPSTTVYVQENDWPGDAPVMAVVQDSVPEKVIVGVVISSLAATVSVITSPTTASALFEFDDTRVTVAVGAVVSQQVA